MAAPSDAYIVSNTERTVVRKCPFCGVPIEDFLGKDINFIVHLGFPTRSH